MPQIIQNKPTPNPAQSLSLSSWSTLVFCGATTITRGVLAMDKSKAIQRAQAQRQDGIDTMYAAKQALEEKERKRTMQTTQPPREKREQILRRAFRAVMDMRDGKASDAAWICMLGTIKAMVAVHRQGAVVSKDVCQILKAWDALEAIQRRHMDPATRQWTTPLQLKAPEIANLMNAVHHHGDQIDNLSLDEFYSALLTADAWTDNQLLTIIEKLRHEAIK